MQLDDTVLEACGLRALSRLDKKILLDALYEDLEMRVGVALSNGLTEKEMEEFEYIIDYETDHRIEGQSSPAAAWLEAKVPQYQDIVKKVYVELLQDLGNCRLVIAEFANIELAPLAQGFPESFALG